MGLIDNEIEVKVARKTSKYYESIGYNIPKYIGYYGTECLDTSQTIIVKTIDLPQNSGEVVRVSCDTCGKESKIRYRQYVKNTQKNGKYYCQKCAMKILYSGERNPTWNPNKTQEERIKNRQYPEYYEFVRKVFARDHDTCVCCGKSIMNHMQVHHLNGYSWFIDGRCDETNAVTLCDTCHSNFHAIYGNKHSTKEQFMEWLNIKVLDIKKYDGEIVPTRRVYCYEDDIVYDSVKIAQITNKYKDRSGIYKVCNHKQKYYTSYGKHWFWYDEYINMTEEEIQYYVSK